MAAALPTDRTALLGGKGGYGSIPDRPRDVFDEIIEDGRRVNKKPEGLIHTVSRRLKSITGSTPPDGRKYVRIEDPKATELASRALGAESTTPAAVASARYVESGIRTVSTPPSDSLDEVTRFLFSRNVKDATNRIVKEGKGLRDPELPNALRCGRYIDVLKAVWSERDHEMRLEWLEAQTYYHSLLLCEQAVTRLSCYFRRKKAEGVPIKAKELLETLYHLVLPCLEAGLFRFEIDRKISKAYVLTSDPAIRSIYLISIDKLMRESTPWGIHSITREAQDQMQASHYEYCLAHYRDFKPERFIIPHSSGGTSYPSKESIEAIKGLIADRISFAEKQAHEGRRRLSEMTS